MSWRGYLFSILGILLGPGLIYDNINDSRERERIAAFDKKAQGLIESGESKGGRSSSYELTVSFRLESGRMETNEFKVDSGFFKDHTNATSITDPAVTVVYDPGNPFKSYLEGSTTNSIPVWVGVSLTLAGIGGLIYGMSKRGAAGGIPLDD